MYVCESGVLASKSVAEGCRFRFAGFANPKRELLILVV